MDNPAAAARAPLSLVYTLGVVEYVPASPLEFG